MAALSEGALSPCPVAGQGGGGGKLPESSEEAGKRDAPCPQGWQTPWLLLPSPLSPTPVQPSEPRKDHPG